jgi:predicted nucleic acid-binding protein
VRFVDTSFWVALRFARDGRHADAKKIWEAGHGGLITTDVVVGETWTFLKRRTSHRRAVEFLDAVTKSPTIAIRHADEDLVDEAWRWLRRHDERSYSFVDASSFALMRRMRLREALAFDGDFAAAGFTEVRP